MTYDPVYNNDKPESILSHKTSGIYISTRGTWGQSNCAMIINADGAIYNGGLGHPSSDSKKQQRPVLYLNNQ